MTHLTRRLILICKTWLHAFVASAEDPREVFEAAHQRQEELLGRVRQAKLNVAAAGKQLVAKCSKAREKLPELEEQARQALRGGREDLARFALSLRQVAAEELENLEGQAEQLEQEERMLTLVEQQLVAQIDAFAARREVLVARYTTAEARVRISEAVGGVSDELAGLDQAIERAEESSENMEARVSAIDQLVEAGILDTPSQAPGRVGLPSLTDGTQSPDVEDRLADLKRELQEG